MQLRARVKFNSELEFWNIAPGLGSEAECELPAREGHGPPRSVCPAEEALGGASVPSTLGDPRAERTLEVPEDAAASRSPCSEAPQPDSY
eukprot:9991452-Alexandrium_andersonii.AAC.1